MSDGRNTPLNQQSGSCGIETVRDSVAQRVVTGRVLVLGALVCAALFVTGCWVDWGRLPIYGLNQTLNDQVGYISVARHLLDEGRLDSSIIYPSVLLQKFRRNSLYMPGYYAELALTFRIFGYSALTARLPAIASFLLACCLVFWIARRLFDLKTAIYALAMFAFCPLNLMFAFTAMAEMSVVAAGLAAFSIFLLVPEKYRWWVGPVALALPILFRETGVALGATISVMLFFSAKKSPKRKAAQCALLVCVVLGALILSPVGAGRPSLWKANILAQGSFDALYSDAFALQHVPDSAQDWMVAVGHKLLSNIVSLIPRRGFEGGGLEAATLLFLLSGIPLGAWLWRKKRDAFALGVTSALCLLLIADLCLYGMWHYRGIHAFLLMEPFVAMLWGVTITLWSREPGPVVRSLLVPFSFVIGVAVAVSIWQAQKDATMRAKEDTSFLESVIGGDRQTVVSPFWLSLDYVNEHYPQRWAFVPANCPTLQLLDLKEGIGTLIVPVQPELEAEFSTCRTGLMFDGDKLWRGKKYWVFRKEISDTKPN